MSILVIAATDAEINAFQSIHANIDTLITGVGVPSTIYNLQKKIYQHQPSLIIQAGIAGSYRGDETLGKTFLVKADCFADLGLEENGNFTPVFDTDFADRHAFPFSDGRLVNNHAYLNRAFYPAVDAVTVNKVSDSKLQLTQIQQTFQPDIETMEGAALHFVCLQEEIPFLQIRTISNLVGERDKNKWMLTEAIENLNRDLSELINQLTYT